MKIYVHRPTEKIVGERALVFIDGITFKNNEKDTIHVRDLARLTKLYMQQRSQSKYSDVILLLVRARIMS